MTSCAICLTSRRELRSESATIRVAGELDDRRRNGREPEAREESPDSESPSMPPQAASQGEGQRAW